MSYSIDNNSNNRGVGLLTLCQKRYLGSRVTSCYECDSFGGNAQNCYSGKLTGVVQIAIMSLVQYIYCLAIAGVD